MPTPSQARVLDAIERVARRDGGVSNRSVLSELLLQGKGASFSTIGPLVAAWRADHPTARTANRVAKSQRESRPKGQTIDAAVATLVDDRIAAILTNRLEDYRSTITALRQEVADLKVMIRTVIDSVAKQDIAVQICDSLLRNVLGERRGHQHTNDVRLPGDKPPSPDWKEMGSDTKAAKLIRATPPVKTATRSSTEIAEGRTLGRLTMEAIFDVLVSRRLQTPSLPAMSAEEIISALPASLQSQIAARIGRSPDRRYLKKLLQPRIERERYVRRDTNGSYLAVPDWRERKERDRHAPKPA